MSFDKEKQDIESTDHFDYVNNIEIEESDFEFDEDCDFIDDPSYDDEYTKELTQEEINGDVF